MIVMSAMLKAKCGKEKEVENALMAMIPKVQNEEGTIEYTIHRSQNNGGLFFLYEMYKDKRSLDYHMSTPLIQNVYCKISKNGSIVMTTGIAGEKIFKIYSTMAIIKNSATEALCRSLAIELASIRVNVVSPGFVAPKAPEVETYAKQFPSGRIASSEEIAGAFISLMKNSYTTGLSLTVDGGQN